MRRSRHRILPGLLLVFLAAACAAPSPGTQGGQNFSEQPLAGTAAVLEVKGLACPQCATNVDLQLKSLPGVSDVRVDLSQGLVHLQLSPGLQPSPHDLAERIRAGGVTLVAVRGE